jgi:hypothetical protein
MSTGTRTSRILSLPEAGCASLTSSWAGQVRDPCPLKASVPESEEVFAGAGTCPAGSILPEGLERARRVGPGWCPFVPGRAAPGARPVSPAGCLLSVQVACPASRV